MTNHETESDLEFERCENCGEPAPRFDVRVLYSEYEENVETRCEECLKS